MPRVNLMFVVTTKLKKSAIQRSLTALRPLVYLDNQPYTICHTIYVTLISVSISQEEGKGDYVVRNCLDARGPI
jgi:hypothetical protein